MASSINGAPLPFAFALLIAGCAHEPDGIAVDGELLERARSTEANVWYAFSDTLLARSIGSGHAAPYLRTRYNSTAASALDSAGRVINETIFPNGALIVKDLMIDAATLERYAIMLKRNGDPAADSEGWIWGYILANGAVAISAADQGAACRSCHGQNGHIDRTLMNKYFP
ncbi:MAG: hypothetical protein IPL52_00260 [Flavobacteriales bacterium]|nr:hypothetical protein [Flavobacteriales bacterium]